MPATFPCRVGFVALFGWPASRRVHKISARSMHSLPGSVTASIQVRILNCLVFHASWQWSTSWNHSCESAAFRFSHENGRITAPLKCISKLRSNPLIVVLRSLPSTCLLPGCGQWTTLWQAGLSRFRQSRFSSMLYRLRHWPDTCATRG